MQTPLNYKSTFEFLTKPVLLLFLICSAGVISAQQYSLNPNLKGYGDCGLQDNPIQCLKNTLSSIDTDEGYYANFSENFRGQIKAEYCLQLSYVYRQMHDIDKSISFLEDAGMYMSQMKVHDDDEMFTQYVLVKETFKEYADNIRELPSDSEQRSQAMKDEAYISGHIVRKTEEVKEAHAEIMGNELLATLKSYLDRNPINYVFLNGNKADSCVIQIKREESANRSVLDTYVKHTTDMEYVGLHLMGISKHLKNKGLIQSQVDMTIIVEPGSRDEILMRDGRFYVYYAHR